MSEVTRTAPARVPDGWWTGHTRYRNYVLFAGSGMVLMGVCVMLLLALQALAGGSESWQAFVTWLGQAPVLALSSFLLLGTLFFSIRWLRVGAKIPSVKLGFMPAPAPALILVAHFGGLVAVSSILLLILSGVGR